MSYPNQPYAPMPPQGPPPRNTSVGKIVALTIGGVFALIIVASVLGAALSGGGESSGKGASSAQQPKDTTDGKAADAEEKAKPDEGSKAEDAERKDGSKSQPAGNTYGDGDYVVGEDIPPGTYESAGANSDILDLCTITTEPKGDKFPQAKTANKNERIIITLSEGDGTLSVQGCHPLKER